MLTLIKNNEIFYSFFCFFICTLLICLFMLILGFFLGGRSYSKSKNIPFESGIIPFNNTRLNFPIKFYLIAVIFIVFDSESPYIYSWSIAIRELGWSGFIEIIIFIIFIIISLVYIFYAGPFKKSNYNNINNNTFKN